MTKRIVLIPYKNGLGGLSLIKEKLRAMDAKVLEVKKEGSRYQQKRNDLSIVWGVPHGGKIQQMSRFRDQAVPCSEFTTDRAVAQEWLDNGVRLLARTVLNGHGGDGIIVVNRGDELPQAPLYVKYTPKQREFRVHYLNGQIKVREKRRRAGWEELEGFNKYVRNHDNGWVFCDELNGDLPDGAVDVCRGAITSLDLSFGAVDLGYHRDTGWNVYEVNTAPGCDNATAQWYADRFVALANE